MKIMLYERCLQLVWKCDVFGVLNTMRLTVICKKATVADGVWVGLC